MSAADPKVPDWATMVLPNTWADQFDLSKPLNLLRFIRCIRAKRQPVQLPMDVPGVAEIPKYVLQEFHSLPNGNYSKRITRGYITGFDHVMLGHMHKARRRIARRLQHCQSVLDLGCAGGRTARVEKDQGVTDVWGLDPSPYLLQHAASDNPDIRFVQGVAEQMQFGDQRFDGISACFLFHEMPPRYLRKAMAECHRLLKPGGVLAICEPSVVQLNQSWLGLLKSFGWQGLYFYWLARFVHEPFLMAWHKTSTPGFFAEAGFEVIEDDVSMPLRHIVLRRR